MAVLTYIEEYVYVDGDGYLDEASLESRGRNFYSGLKSDEKPVREPAGDLHDSFQESVNEI